MKYIIIAYLTIFIIVFGYASHRNPHRTEDGKVDTTLNNMESVWLGVVWPFYLSYILFEPNQLEK